LKWLIEVLIEAIRVIAIAILTATIIILFLKGATL